MKGLLLKDFYLMFKNCKLYLIIAIFFAVVASFAHSTNYFSILSVWFAGLIPYILMAYDEKDKWDVYALTLPVSRAQLVASKYIVGIITNSATALISSAVLFIRCRSFKACLFYMASMIIFSLLFPSISLPVMYRFGVVKGKMIVAIFAGIIGGLSAVIVNSKSFSLNVSEVLSDNTIALPVFGAALFGLYIISCLISIKVYQKREI